jgi:hypothetical protein
MPVDIANFLARNSPRYDRAEMDREFMGNKLLKNDVSRLPQANRMQDQDIQMQDLAIQGAQQNQATSRTGNAMKLVSGVFAAAADSPDPVGTWGQMAQNQTFRAAATELGIPLEQFVAQPGEDIVPSLRAWAQATGGSAAVSRLENPDIPSNVRVAEYYAGLPQEGNGVTRSIFNEANRAPTVREIGAVQTSIGPGGSTTPLGTLGAEADAQRQIAAARAGGTATGGAQGAAVAGLPDALADIDKMKRDIQGFLTHPGFATVYGKSRPAAFIPGSQAAGAEGRRRTLDAQAFGITIQKMRGLGALSNAEGQRVTDAFTHATNASISEEEAQGAWGEVNYYLDLAAQRAQQKAGGATQGGGMPDFTNMSTEELMRIASGGQ